MEEKINVNRHGEKSELLSVVVPAYNEAGNLPYFYERLCSVLENDGWPFELIVVDDGSTDRTLAVVKELRLQDPRVQYISLSRNFGHQAALLAGLERSQGDVVISMDADLQHPPETIPRMLSLWLEGYDIVHPVKRSDASASILRKVIAKIFYKTFALLSDVNLSFGPSDFRLLDAKVVRELRCIPEHDKFLRGLVSWMGFRQGTIDYDVAPRFDGKPTYSLTRRLKFHVNGILSFSIIPLRLFTLLGLLVCVPTGFYGLFALGAAVYGHLAGYPAWLVPGWASLAIFVTFLGGIQLIGIGILGEYLGRIFEQTKGRPAYLIKETSLGMTGQPAHWGEPEGTHGRQESRPGERTVLTPTFHSAGTPSTITPSQPGYLSDFLNESVIGRTIEGQIQFWNRRAEELYGWRKEEAIGRVTHDLLQTQFPKPLKEIDYELVRNGRWEGKLVHTTRDGDRIAVQSRWTLDRNGEPGAVVEINALCEDPPAGEIFGNRSGARGEL